MRSSFLAEPVTDEVPISMGLVFFVNLILGVPGVVPVWLAWFYLTQWPLVALGVTTQDPSNNDGVLVGSIAFLPVIVLGLLVWFFVGLWLRRRVDPEKTPRFWPVSVLAVLTPTAGLILGSLVS